MSYNITDEVFSNYIKQSFSISQVLQKMNLKPSGGNYKVMKNRISKLNLDCSHFTGKAHNKGKTGLNHKGKKGKPLVEILKRNSYYTSSKLIIRLIAEEIKSEKCEVCGLSEWNGKKIPLEIDHINGINTDNRINNLRILCPNCHAQTDTYRGRNKLSAYSKRNRVEPLKFGETLTLEGDGNPERNPKGNV